jgi:DNA-binding XRE family transcriptional regulator
MAAMILDSPRAYAPPQQPRPCVHGDLRKRTYLPRAPGARMAELRKQQDITQVEMAKALGVSQQTINSHEVGRRRIPVSALSTLARTLGVSFGRAARGRVRCGR